MTDHPRFEPLQGPPERLHERYHGGALVGFILWLADRYLERRKPWLERRQARAGHASLGVRRARLRALLAAMGMGAAVLTIALGGGPRPGGGHASQASKVAACGT